jgi:hypothetical protein
MALVSSTINCLRVSNRAAAPEKVKATSSPNRAKTAPSMTPLPATAPSAAFARRRRPIRRPTSKRRSMPSDKLRL